MPAASQIHLFGGDPGLTGTRKRETVAVSVLKEQVPQKPQVWNACPRRGGDEPGRP